MPLEFWLKLRKFSPWSLSSLETIRSYEVDEAIKAFYCAYLLSSRLFLLISRTLRK